MKKLGLVGAVLISGAAFAADGIKLGGFADVGFTWQNTSPDATKTFGVGRGAFYFGKTMGMGEVLVDLPFEHKAAGGPNAILAGFDQAQAWVSWKYDNGFSWKMGQFDGIFGHEANDSWDRFFSNSGQNSALLPTTETGLLVGYKASDALNVSFLVSDPYNTATTAAGGKWDFGVKVESNQDAFTAAAGMLFSTAASTAATPEYEWTANVVAGSKMGQLNTTLELIMHNDKTASKTPMAFGGHFEYAMNEGTDIGASIEWMKNAADAKNLELRVGPKFNMNKDFNVRLAYQMDKPDTGSTTSTVTLNAVHKF